MASEQMPEVVWVTLTTKEGGKWATEKIYESDHAYRRVDEVARMVEAAYREGHRTDKLAFEGWKDIEEEHWRDSYAKAGLHE